MEIIRWDPAKHPRGRRGTFRKVLKALKPDQELRLPGNVRVVKTGGGAIRISTSGTHRQVEPQNLDQAVTLALTARELQDEVDDLHDHITGLPRGESEDFDVPGGKLTVDRQEKSDPDGWEYTVSGVGMKYVSGVTSDEVAEMIARRRQHPSPPQSPGVEDAPMGTLTATAPFSFEAAGASHSVAAGGTLDVLRKSGGGWVVRTPDKKGIGVIWRGAAPVLHRPLRP